MAASGAAWQCVGMAKRDSKPASESFNEICTLRIDLLGTKPPIWRALEVPTSMTLLTLNDVVQIAMGWFGAHLWEFTAGKRRYGPRFDDEDGDDPPADAGVARLRDLLGRGVREVRYVYDFGDGWEHRLKFSDVRQGDPALDYPRYIAGERAGPPEDCGGIAGFYQMLDVLADPAHPDHDEVADWLDEYDPEEIDVTWLETALRRIARKRNGPRKRLAKPPQ